MHASRHWPALSVNKKTIDKLVIYEHSTSTSQHWHRAHEPVCLHRRAKAGMCKWICESLCYLLLYHGNVLTRCAVRLRLTEGVGTDGVRGRAPWATKLTARFHCVSLSTIDIFFIVTLQILSRNASDFNMDLNGCSNFFQFHALFN